MIIVVAERAIAISCSRGGIHEWKSEFNAYVPDVFCVIQIQLVENFLVKFSGVGSGTNMKDKLYKALIFFEPVDEKRTFNTLCKLFSRIIFTFLRMRKIINKNKIVKSFFIEF